MRAIVAVDENWAIGKDNNLLFHIKEDLQRFKTLTIGRAVVMGRKTFESLPDRKPLEGRDNYILTRDENYFVEGAIVVNSYSDFLSNYANKYPSDNICIIGGSEIYKLFLNDVNNVYLTKVHKSVEGADAFFPNLNEMEEWEIADRSEVYKSKHGIEYEFILYKK